MVVDSGLRDFTIPALLFAMDGLVEHLGDEAVDHGVWLVYKGKGRVRDRVRVRVKLRVS